MNLSPSQRFDLERLISIQLDGEPTDDEVLRLENLLRGDSECRRHYLRFVDLHAQLLQHPGLALLSPPPSGPPAVAIANAGPSPLSIRAAWRPYLLTALIASAVSLLTQYLWMRPSTNIRPLTPASVATVPTSASSPAPQARPPVTAYFATFVSVEDCQWGDGVSRRTGMRLGPETLRMERGRVTLRFDGGSLLTLEGAAELRVIAADSAFLSQGRLLLRSDDSADPFDLLTPHARWVDSGSEFALIVDARTEEVHMLRGEVIRTPTAQSKSQLAAGSTQQTLTAGHARRYDAGSAVDGVAVPFDTEWMKTTSTIVGKLKADKQRGLIAYDSFDPQGSFAWRGAWALHDPDETEGTFGIVGGLRHAAMPMTSMSSGAGFLKHRVAVSRLAPQTLQTDVDGAFYFSFLTRADRRPTEGKPCFVQLSFRKHNDTEPRRRLAATVSWSRSSVSVGWEGAGQQASVPLDFGRTYLVVGKMLASADGPDQAFVRLYGTKDRLSVDEPLSWTVASRPAVSRTNFDLVQWFSMSEFGIAVDELRLGTNWAAVAEPYQSIDWAAPTSLRIPPVHGKK